MSPRRIYYPEDRIIAGMGFGTLLALVLNAALSPGAERRAAEKSGL
jgi:hypothetical protein